MIDCTSINIEPHIAYGTWKLENAIANVKSAIDAGYRHIDTANAYGNERDIGKGILTSNIERKQIFLTGKLWNTMRDFEKAQFACKRSLKHMGIDYFDCYLIHWPAAENSHENWDKINAETWRGMEELYKNGLAKFIGVSNFSANHLEELKKTAKILPMVNQIEIHPGMPQLQIRDYCTELGISVEAWSPLGSGEILDNKVLKEIAARYKKSVAQICIKWCLQNKITPIVKSNNFSRMKANMNVFDFSISDDDMNIINEIPYCGGSGLDPNTQTGFA